ncbi:MAG: AmmeMemoRadiSam system radical SAM enzyme [Planctomycetes bacterium]|jgi:pyruvate formate lyase activating enzyme|nr:AmmeMemoRadiSam system radical SAM enzyme [Planctomycetota bacterium]
MDDLAGMLDGRTAPAAKALVEVLEGGRVRCLACGHRCRIPAGKRGICKVRRNEGGTLRVPFGYVAGLAVDPIEKKPFYHLRPGASALSFGMLGCDLHCPWCQNWLTSQALRDGSAGGRFIDLSPAAIAGLAVERGAPVVTSTYNEPLITADWAAAVFDAAKDRGLLTSFVSNGHGTPEVLDFLAPRLDAMKVDLKSFRPEGYREAGGTLAHVLATIEGLAERSIWCEVVTLVIPGYNDSDGELRAMASFLAGVSPDIPWHVTTFHPDYRYADRDATPAATLLRACDLGREAGLRYVYPGNVHGSVGDRENTFCPACGGLLVGRRGYRISPIRIGPDGKCPDCGAKIPGLWGDSRLPSSTGQEILSTS